MSGRSPVPRLNQDQAQKWAPRQANGEASDAATPSGVQRGSTTPRVTSTPRSRFSNNHSVTSPTQASPGGSTLFVAGMGSAQRRRQTESGSHMFRSGTSVADAHIKDCGLRVTPGPYAAARSTMGAPGTAAFRSKSPSDRDSHMRSLLGSTYGSPRSQGARSPGRQTQLASASFRSASPTACAHILAMPKVTDASYNMSPSNRDHRGSAPFRSTTSIADAHIKASPKMHDGTIATPRGHSREVTSPFRSTTSIGDAHIKAVPKPVDVVVAYRD